MTMAALFIAQACNVDLSISEQIALLLVAMKFVNARHSDIKRSIPRIKAIPATGTAGTTDRVAARVIIGIDRFMSECRALTNLVGNACATIVVARWDKALGYRFFIRLFCFRIL
jgi:aerobic C4-dicarboxylate transport protein